MLYIALASTTNGWSFGYDGNGNMTTRNSGTSYTYGYDVENRLTTVSGGTTATFVYDGDGVRVKGTAGGVTTTYVGNYFEWTGSTSTMKKYYYAGATRIAMRTGTADPLWLLGDHLGSTSRVANRDGSAYTNGWQLYKPWGEKRYPSGASGLPTTFRFTGQRQESSLGGTDGLYYYGARWYDPSLNRWTQPDTDVPESQGVQAWDRFAYTSNNPVNNTDPSGHATCTDDGNCGTYSVSAETHRFGIQFEGEWTDNQKLNVIAGVGAVADKLGQVLGISAANAFRNVYNIGQEKLSFIMGSCEECHGGGAFTHDSHHIEYDNEAPFYGQTISGGGVRSTALASEMNIHGVIHELGHAFNDRLSGIPEKAVPSNLYGTEGFAEEPAGGNGLWTPNYFQHNDSEAFANMFLGWVYGKFGSDQTGLDRAALMTQMNGKNGWVQEATGP
jgi:RHS repeat-associated protein